MCGWVGVELGGQAEATLWMGNSVWSWLARPLCWRRKRGEPILDVLQNEERDFLSARLNRLEAAIVRVEDMLQGTP